LIDESPVAAYDSLDPGVGFFVTDGYFANVFQGLVSFDPTNFTNVVPSLASSWTVSSNFVTYTFTMRANTWFSNKDPVNAYVAWFSFVRELYMNDPDGVGIANFADITVNTSTDIVGPNANTMPHGLRAALVNAGVPNNENSLVSALNQMLSNFNPTNATQLKIMSYPNQAYVAVSSSTFQVNLIQPYNVFLLDLPPQWGAIVDPTFVDAHGGVANNTQPAYFTTNGMVGTGPYVYQANPPAGNSLLVLNENPNYWANGVSGLNAAIQPAKIPTVIMEFGNEPNTEIQDFGANKAQIVAPPIAQLGQAYSSYGYKSQYTFNDLYVNAGYPLCDLANGLNTQVYPTNITLLRQAMVHAVNYSSILAQLYTFNGTALAELFIPPVPPGWGPLDNPQNIPLYSYNIPMAIQLANQAGLQNHFSLLLPNGTKIGDKSAPQLPPVEYAYVVPATPETQTLIAIMSDGLSNIGVQLAATGITEAVYEADEVQPSTGFPIVGVGWCADFPDPIYQQFFDMATTVTHQPNWVNNATLNTLLAEIPFETNSTLQLQQTEQAYAIFTQLATILQVPNAQTYFLRQPYVTGLLYSPFQFAILYNMMSYKTS